MWFNFHCINQYWAGIFRHFIYPVSVGGQIVQRLDVKPVTWFTGSSQEVKAIGPSDRGPPLCPGWRSLRRSPFDSNWHRWHHIQTMKSSFLSKIQSPPYRKFTQWIYSSTYICICIKDNESYTYKSQQLAWLIPLITSYINTKYQSVAVFWLNTGAWLCFEWNALHSLLRQDVIAVFLKIH